MTLPWRIWKRSTRRRPAVFEKRIEGFIDRRIPHKPPHKSVLHIIYGNQTEAGYASCIRLLDEGQSMALLTAAHVLRDPCNKFVYSLRTKNSISISNFTPVYWDVEGDVVVLKGPSNWTSVLGCTPAHYATADKVSKSNVEWYRYEDGEWYMHNAEITDVYDTGSAPSAAVHSITEFGDSGTPYFCGKIIQGVHTGGAIKDNCNILSPLPPIPGLFSMRYITESPKPKGRIFSDEDIADFVERAQSLIKFKSATGMNWSDMLDDNSLPPVPIYKESKILSEEEDAVEDYLSQRVSPPLTTPTISAEKAIPEEESAVDEYIAHFTGPKYILESSGNGMGRADCLNNGEATKLSAVLNTEKLESPLAPTLTQPPPATVTEKATSSVPGGNGIPSLEDLTTRLLEIVAEKIDSKKVQEEAAHLIMQQARQRKRKPRGKRGGKSKQTPSENTSEASISGKYQPPHQRSPDSATPVSYPSSTTRKEKWIATGVVHSRPPTLNSPNMSKDSAGLKQGPKQS